MIRRSSLVGTRFGDEWGREERSVIGSPAR
ncbi:hypothetical protein L332_00030 [Agrococcus pavilionensis RW1]|uniref:Uncharacterized protein n=1 Tax=Agrococcus pavilionensis RW1 TaxID=1330458 RepID=U1LKR2_9MICO|nr:hypothetical protein L332_00030 [Agrococcus pavilionensis RW1]